MNHKVIAPEIPLTLDEAQSAAKKYRIALEAIANDNARLDTKLFAAVAAERYREIARAVLKTDLRTLIGPAL